MAQRKPAAELVEWVVGDVAALPPLAVDLVTMTANLAQVFVADDEWAAVLRAAREALRPGGGRCSRAGTRRRGRGRSGTANGRTPPPSSPGVGPVETWVKVLAAGGDLTTLRWTFVFGSDDAVLTSESTLRFRTRVQLVQSVTAAGLIVDEVRGAPDRPSHELVVLARRPD